MCQTSYVKYKKAKGGEECHTDSESVERSRCTRGTTIQLHFVPQWEFNPWYTSFQSTYVDWQQFE
eukprot:scaffold141942_cov75-Cyclotella_meneghiniana.AAC.2